MNFSTLLISTTSCKQSEAEPTNGEGLMRAEMVATAMQTRGWGQT